MEFNYLYSRGSGLIFLEIINKASMISYFLVRKHINRSAFQKVP